MARVFLEDIKKLYEGNEEYTIKGTTLEINDKEFIVLVGPSGCGKSTTLRMIAGLEDITEGKIHIGSKVVNNLPPKDRDIAMVFQNYALYPHMDVYDNMAFGLKLRKFSKAEIDKRVKDAASILGLEDLLARKPKALSGGQRQRVALGRAIVREPQVFLMDEPLSNLDAKLRVQMRTEINKLHKRLNATIVYVTHDQVEAMTMGDRIAIYNLGDIQQCATPYEVYNNPANKFVAGFIGSPAMNFVNCDIENNILTAKNFKIKLPDSFKNKISNYSKKKVIFGIRPEDIYLKSNKANNTLKSTDDNTVSTKIDVIEPMGAEIFIYFSISGVNITARVDSDATVKYGDNIDVVLNLEKCHLFDIDTEDRLK